ncbi:MAG: hypothetical protein AAGG01_11850 [Planctomycetota bacterium]
MCDRRKFPYSEEIINALPTFLALGSLALASHARADLPQPEVPDFRGFENTNFLGWNDWTELTTVFGGGVFAATPEVLGLSGTFAQIFDPAGLLDTSTPGVICSSGHSLNIDYGGPGIGKVVEVVLQISGPDAELVNGSLWYSNFPDPDALSPVEARDLDGGGKLFRFLAEPFGLGWGTLQDFPGFSIRLIHPDSTATLCLDEVHLDVRHDLTGTESTVCFVPGPNSVGVLAGLDLGGSSAASDNLIELTASGIPAASVGIFLASQGVGSVACSGSCVGSLCLDPADVGRIGPAMSAGSDLSFERLLDLTSIPTNPTASAMAGQSWYFQAWYRDAVTGTPVSRFTDSAGIVFQ